MKKVPVSSTLHKAQKISSKICLFFVAHAKTILYSSGLGQALFKQGATLDLYDHQVVTVNECRDLIRQGCKSILIRGATGSGKTILTAFMLKGAAKKNWPSLFNVHRRELIKQSSRSFEEVGVEHGIIAAGWKWDKQPLTQIAGIQTLSRRIDDIETIPRLIIWDECHHLGAKSWAAIYNRFPDAIHIGLTATPWRLDGKGLGRFFQKMIKGPSERWLIDNGYLSPYRLYAPKSINVEGVRKSMGDYVHSELEAICDKPAIVGDAVREYRKWACGKRAIVFTVSIKASLHMAEAFNAAGFRARHIDGDTPTDVRDETMQTFSDGGLDVLCSVDLHGEGVDVPALECVINARPTCSFSLARQQWGRSLRKFPGKKEAIIIDMAGFCREFGLPDDEIEWSLEDRPKKQKNSDGPAIRICPQCFAAQRPGRSACQYCDAVFPVQHREVEEIDGDLEEVDREALRRSKKREEARAQSYDDLLKIEKARGYRHGWAWHRFNARQMKRKGAAG